MLNTKSSHSDADADADAAAASVDALASRPMRLILGLIVDREFLSEPPLLPSLLPPLLSDGGRANEEEK